MSEERISSEPELASEALADVAIATLRTASDAGDIEIGPALVVVETDQGIGMAALVNEGNRRLDLIDLFIEGQHIAWRAVKGRPPA